MSDDTQSAAQQGQAQTDAIQPSVSGFRDDELVYVDPDARAVVGRVEWSRNGNPKSMPVKIVAEPVVAKQKGEERRKFSSRKYYPWGSYKSMKNVYRLEGKQKKAEPSQSLDDVIVKALEQPFWD